MCPDCQNDRLKDKGQGIESEISHLRYTGCGDCLAAMSINSFSRFQVHERKSQVSAVRTMIRIFGINLGVTVGGRRFAA